jgi:hypothetical protein
MSRPLNKAKVKPTLLKWGEEIHPYDTQPHEASSLSKTIEQTGCILIILKVNKQIRGISQATVKYTYY